MLSVSHAGPNFGGSLAAPPWVGPVPGLHFDLALQTLGTGEDVIVMPVRRRVQEAVRSAYPYCEDLHPRLQPVVLKDATLMVPNRTSLYWGLLCFLILYVLSVLFSSCVLDSRWQLHCIYNWIPTALYES